MPELPEVETVVRILRGHIVGATISAVWFDRPHLIKDVKRPGYRGQSKPAAARFRQDIIGQVVSGLRRAGKNVLIDFKSGQTMLVHQKMTGHLLVGKWEVKKNKAHPISPAHMVTDPWNGYIRMVLQLKDGRTLALSDLRRFAKVILASREHIEALPDLSLLGPDALSDDLTVKDFERILEKQRRPIKQVLMDPVMIAGVGNIYSDEALWRSKIHPKRPANKLSGKEVRELYKNMRLILKEAIRLRGTSMGDFRDPNGMPGEYSKSRRVYQRKNEPCLRCKMLIERMVVGGRSAHYCPKCQV